MKMSLPTASFDPPPAAIYESNTPPQYPEVSDLPINNEDDDTSNKDKDDGSGDKGSDVEETEDVAFHCAAREIRNRAGQRVGTVAMDWGGGDGW